MENVMCLGMRVVIKDHRHIYDEFEDLAKLLNLMDWEKRDCYDFNLKHGEITQLCFHPTTGNRIAVVRTDCGMVGFVNKDGLIVEPKELKPAIIIDIEKITTYCVEWECPSCGAHDFDDIEDDGFDDESCFELHCCRCGYDSYYKEK